MNAMKPHAVALPRSGGESILASNRVIRNTYMLLSMTLLFSAVADRLGRLRAADVRTHPL
jgi:hypothetical protein